MARPEALRRACVAGTGRTPFPGNRIDASRIQPIPSKILSLVPLPNLAGLNQNYFTLIPFVRNTNQYDIKGDQDGNIYVVGYTTSGDLPIVGNALEPAQQGGVDGFALKFNPSRSGGAGFGSRLRE